MYNEENVEKLKAKEVNQDDEKMGIGKAEDSWFCVASHCVWKTAVDYLLLKRPILSLVFGKIFESVILKP